MSLDRDCEGMWQEHQSTAAALYSYSKFGDYFRTAVLSCDDCGDWWVIGIAGEQSQMFDASCAADPNAACEHALGLVGQAVPTYGV